MKALIKAATECTHSTAICAVVIGAAHKANAFDPGMPMAPCCGACAVQAKGDRIAVPGQTPRIRTEATMRNGWDMPLRHADGSAGMTGLEASALAPARFQTPRNCC